MISGWQAYHDDDSASQNFCFDDLKKAAYEQNSELEFKEEHAEILQEKASISLPEADGYLL